MTSDAAYPVRTEHTSTPGTGGDGSAGVGRLGYIQADLFAPRSGTPGVEGGWYGATRFSPCGRYRYELVRIWGRAPGDGGRVVLWTLCNPTTADAERLDPTLRRCRSFSRAWNFDGMIIRNIFALRSTDPMGLYELYAAGGDPVGPKNDATLLDREGIALTVVGWGCHGALLGRGRQVASMLDGAGRTLVCLGLTRDGHPCHPLYLPGTTEPHPYIPLRVG